MKNKKQKGFTLIELLVVIAIIGLLATIALASLNSARRKAAVASMKANLANISAQAELYYDDNGYYSQDTSTESSCLPSLAIVAGALTGTPTGVFADPVIVTQITRALESSAPDAAAICFSGPGGMTAIGQFWAISIDKPREGALPYCIDNSGFKGFGKTAIGTGLCT